MKILPNDDARDIKWWKQIRNNDTFSLVKGILSGLQIGKKVL